MAMNSIFGAALDLMSDDKFTSQFGTFDAPKPREKRDSFFGSFTSRFGTFDNPKPVEREDNPVDQSPIMSNEDFFGIDTSLPFGQTEGFFSEDVDLLYNEVVDEEESQPFPQTTTQNEAFNETSSETDVFNQASNVSVGFNNNRRPNQKRQTKRNYSWAGWSEAQRDYYLRNKYGDDF